MATVCNIFAFSSINYFYKNKINFLKKFKACLYSQMTHLSQDVCGVDLFLSLNRTNSNVLELSENIKIFCSKYQLLKTTLRYSVSSFFLNNSNNFSWFASDEIQFSDDYLNNLRIQAFRSKCFVFIIDRFALECSLFLSNFNHAKVSYKVGEV